MVILVGPPASGKSFISKHYFVPKGYERINRDTLQTQQRCKQRTKEALREGKSVIIDNTNPDKKTRESYIKIAQELSIIPNFESQKRYTCSMFPTRDKFRPCQAS